jgi:hypothetical protein
MFDSLKNTLAILIVVLIAVACAPESRTADGGFEKVYSCNAENLENNGRSFSESDGKSLTFGNVETRTSEEAFSGNHALKLTPEDRFGFTTEFRAGADEYVQVTAWRKSSNSSGVIVIDGGEGFYNAGKFVVEEGENGWEKIFLEVFTPPHFLFGKVKVYVWNNSGEPVYFDDIQIVHRHTKDYPEYEPFSALHIYAEEQHLNFFNQKRIEAFAQGVLVNEDADYSGIVIFDGNDFLNGEFRLKGDLMDHIQGDKWSFRIKLKKDFAWNNVRTFSVQDPITRSFLHEWLAHRIFDREDVLTTRYGFVPLVLNNQSKGIYAWEEHFEKHLVESRNRREGPIVRFDETLFWNRSMEFNKTEKLWDVDYFGAAKITPFKEGSTTSDSLKTRQAVEAQKLLLQYKNWSMPVSEIFDIDILARYYALMDITQAYHGFTWHNQRFYFNPVTCLLEPIAFDGFIENGVYRRIEEPVISLLDPAKIESFRKEELLLYQVFTDSLFNKKYLNYLKAYSNPVYIEQMIDEYSHESDSLENLIRMEFPYYRFSFDFIRQQAELIKENLEDIAANIPKLGKAFSEVNREKFKKQFTAEANPELTPLMVHAYFDKSTGKMEILNYHGSEISVFGALISDNLPVNFSPRVEVTAYDGLNPGKASVQVQGEPYRLVFSVGGQTLETDVSHWPFSDDLSARQRLVRSANTGDLPWSGDSVVFSGEYTFASDVYIPANKKVIFQPGTKINLTGGAGFFSFSAFRSNGEEDALVEFFSSDRTSQGVHVLQAAERSVLSYTRFYQLGSIDRGGWQTPSAVTFYEADVDFYRCMFESNVNCDDALNTVRSDFVAENCRFENTFADAFDSDFCTGEVINCTFVNIGNDAIDFSGSVVTISGCEMTMVDDKAISGGENSTLFVENCIIEKATIGVASKDLSHVELNNIEMTNTVYGFVVFIKKPEYGPATITARNIEMKDNMVLHQIEEGSKLTFEGTDIHGREKDLATKLYQ